MSVSALADRLPRPAGDQRRPCGTARIGPQRVLLLDDPAQVLGLLAVNPWRNLGKGTDLAHLFAVATGRGPVGLLLGWVPLNAVVDPTEVPMAIATGIGVIGAVGDEALAPVVRALTDRQALLVFDNCEQVAAACGESLASLLDACPTVPS